MQNLITANSVNTALDEAAANLGGGSSSNFMSKVSRDSQSGEKFSKIFKDTTRRQNEAAASTTNATSTVNTTNTANTTGTTSAPSTANTVNTASAANTEDTVSTTDVTNTANTTTPTSATSDNDIKEAEAPEIKKCAAQAEIATPVMPVIPEIQAEVEPAVEVEPAAEVDDQSNLNELTEVKAPEILIMQASVPIQEDFKVVANEAETTIAPGQNVEISNLEVDNNTKDTVIKTAMTEEEQKPAQSETRVQGQNIGRDVVQDVVQDENSQEQDQAISREIQPKTQAKNQATEEQAPSKGPTMEVPQEAVVTAKTDTLFVNENDIVGYEGEVVQIEQPQTKKPEDTAYIKAIDKDIIDELEAKVEKVIVAPQAQANNGKVLNSTLSASEQIVKFSIEDALTVKSDKNAQDAGADDLLNSGKQDFSPETFKLHSGTSVHNNANSAAGTTFDEALKNDVLNQIGTKFEQLKQDGGVGKITLTLRPLDLGRVVIELTQNASGVTTNIIAQNSSVKELLEKNIEGLKQQLAQAGVNVQNINVKSADSAENSEQREHGEHHQEERQERQDQSSGNSGQKNNKDSEKEEQR